MAQSGGHGIAVPGGTGERIGGSAGGEYHSGADITSMLSFYTANRPVMAGLAIPGILRISGTLEPVANLEDVMRVAKNAGAKRILLPMSSIADLQGISPELIGSVSPEFYESGDAVAAAKKALGV